MSIDPAQPHRPSRIIVPGAEPAISSEPGDLAAPRIVLPPGASDTGDDDLPDFPRLRPLELIPVRDGDRDYLVVTDPVGLLPEPVALRLEALEIMQLLDGSVSLNDLVALVARESKDIRAGRFVRDFVTQLDRMLLLESPRFERALAEVRSTYHQLEVRQAALGGVSYPGESRAAEAFFAEHFAAAEKLRDGEAALRTADATAGISVVHAPGDQKLPRALLVPHLDPRRAGAAIARGYLELDGAASNPPEAPLRVVVFGVGHALFGDLFALTRKHFETPFGKLPCDTPFVDAVASHLGELAYRGELAHRDEHSIEFQAVYLRHRFPHRRITLAPILCGSFHALASAGQHPRENAEMEALVDAVRGAEKSLGGDTVYVAGVDFSHVGARFGDPAPDERTLREVEEKDRAAAEAARRGDADGWHEAIASHQDSTRICGWGATYAMIRCAEPGPGRLLHYEQSHEDGGSTVTIATMVWP